MEIRIEAEQKEKLKREIEYIVLGNIRLEWNSTFEILRAFTDFTMAEGIKQTLSYWEEFKESEIYKGYWENPKLDIEAPWWIHLDEIIMRFVRFIRDKRENERRD